MSRALLVITAVAAVLAAPATAFGHAVLEGSSPARGAVLHAQPRAVVFRFSEPVETALGAVRVFDAGSARVDDGTVGHPRGRRSQVATGLRPGLLDGTYVATYRVVSADGHPVSGGVAFSIGRPGAAAASVDKLLGASRAGPITQTAFGVARGLTYLATALVLGGVVFALAVWLPALRVLAPALVGASAPGRARARLRVLLLAACVVGALCGAAGIVLQGAGAGGTTAWSALDSGVVAGVLETRFGRVWALRALAFAVLAGLLWRSPVTITLAAPALAVLAIAPALAGHAAASSPAAALVALDVVHLVAMSAWIGGLACLLLLAPAATRRLEPGERTRLLAAVLTRFSPLALACVAALVATGAAQALVHVDAWSELTETGYGRAVLLKVALLGALIAIAAVNRSRLVPRLRGLAAEDRPPGAAGRLLRRTLRAEVALVVAVLGVTAVLVSSPPPSSIARGPFTGHAALGSLRLEATVDPARIGRNAVHLYLLRGSDGAPFTGTKELTVTLALPDRRIGPIAATARAAGPGHYVLDALALAPAGDWRLRVEARVSDFDQYEATLEVPIR